MALGTILGLASKFILPKDKPKPEEVIPQPTFMDKTNEFLGTDTGRIGSDIGGQFLGDFRTRRNTRNQYDFLEGKGLTPFEIAGSGGGGTVKSAGNTLGSGPATQAKAQQSFQATEKAKDRALALKLGEMQQQDRQSNIAISERAETRQRDVAEMQIHDYAAKYDVIIKQARQMDFDYHNKWAMKYATMSSKNVMMAIMARYYGFSGEQILSHDGNMSPESMKDLNNLFKDLVSLEATGSRELMGLYNILDKVTKGKTGQPMTNPNEPENRYLHRLRTGTGTSGDAYRKWRRSQE